MYMYMSTMKLICITDKETPSQPLLTEFINLSYIVSAQLKFPLVYSLK